MVSILISDKNIIQNRNIKVENRSSQNICNFLTVARSRMEKLQYSHNDKINACNVMHADYWAILIESQQRTISISGKCPFFQLCSFLCGLPFSIPGSCLVGSASLFFSLNLAVYTVSTKKIGVIQPASALLFVDESKFFSFLIF